MGGDEKNKASKKFQKSYFDVLGLCCSSEVPLIEKILKPLDGVKDVSVIVPSRTVIVVHDNLLVSQLQIVKALNQARLEANVRVHGETNYQKKWPSLSSIVCGIFLSLSFLKYVYSPLQWLALGAVVVGICPIFLRAIAAVRNFTLDTNILVLIAVMGSIALHDYMEAGAIVFLFSIAQWLESRASHKATAVMSSLMNIVPQKAVLAETGGEVDADQVVVNTILAVKAGEIIPIDGIVVQGNCDVDEKTLTGESFPVSKQNDSTVWAGTINLNGYISVKTTALAQDTVVARMSKLVEEAQHSKSKTQRLIDKCAKFYTPAIVAISAGLAVLPATLRVHNQKHWFHLALVVLVSACPCALILSTPVATFCALSKAATSGLLIKGGEYLETLSKIKIMAFDKTGTITRGEFVVTSFESLSDHVSLNTLLFWVSSIESKSSHPMAAAIIEYGRSHSIEPMPEKVEEFENFPGEGIHGKIDGKVVYVGNQKIALRAGCATVPSLEGDIKVGKSIGYIFLGAAPAGIFSLSDACRTGAKEAINELKSMGIKTVMLTGDSPEAALLAQNQLMGAMEVVHAGLLPQDKTTLIKDFQKEAPTAMVGDGLNDAPALATADIGISMGISGSALATATGQVILMSNDIRKIPKVIQLARRTSRKVIVNVILSILTKTAILALAFAGYPLVWAAVLADVGTCLVVILNSMLLLQGDHTHVAKCCKSSPKAHDCKEGSNSHGCHSSHTHQHCCTSDYKAQTVSARQRCCSKRCAPSFQPAPSSSSTCDNKNNSNSVETSGSCGHVNHRQETKHSDHKNCDLVTLSVGLNHLHNHGCSGPFIPSSCVEKKCSKIVGSHKNCVEGDGPRKASQCDHGNHNKSAHDMDSSSLKCHSYHSSSGVSHNMTTNGHCHSTQYCKHNHAENCSIAEEFGNVAVHSVCNRHGADNCSQSRATFGILPVINHTGCTTTKACVNLEKRQIGGCCESFRKECCGKNGHFGASLSGGLSEIITE